MEYKEYISKYAIRENTVYRCLISDELFAWEDSKDHFNWLEKNILKEHKRLKNEYKKYFTFSSSDYYGPIYLDKCNQALKNLYEFEKKHNLDV